MRLYKVTARDVSNNEDIVRWFGTQSECASERAELNRKHGFKRDAITTEEVDVPTTKKELLAWLNQNATG